MRSKNHNSAGALFCDRRQWLHRCGLGFGTIGLAGLLQNEGNAAAVASANVLSTNPLASRPPHYAARAKSVIWLFINGGPSQVDTFDYKPSLEKWQGKSLKDFDSSFKDTTGFFRNQVGGLMPSPFKFQRHGECGKHVSSLFPKLAQHVDKMAFIHSAFSESNNHSPALFMMNSGLPRMGYPSVGSWVTYGLGSESQSLPAFVVMSDPRGRGLPKGNANNWSAGFLPSVYQGTWIKPQGEPIDNLRRVENVTAKQQRRELDFLREANRLDSALEPGNAELAARIESFEIAYRMQTAAPEAFDLASESKHIRQLYGLDNDRCAHFGVQCLIARRLVERGVRFVQIYSGGMENQLSWDGHADIVGNHTQFAGETDLPIAGLLEDLSQRGLLDETLVIWGGEFGRLPIAQTGAKPGRDHNPHACTFWLAGGGVKGGVSYGETDEVGYRAAVDRVHVNDLHATILHLLGIDHTQLTYLYNGRPFRLTDVGGEVLTSILT
jgi:hypothetical protein